jgi:hypothetical protein
MSTITWQFQAAIPGGPALTIKDPPIAVQAYDVATATIGVGDTVDVLVAPPATAGDVVLVVVSSDQYGAGLTYLDGGSATHELDAPHVLLGSGAVGFMNGGTPPQKLSFTNGLAKPANVQVVVGRK